MVFFIAKRLGQMVLIMLVASILVFLLLELNRDNVAVNVLGPYSTDEQRLLWLEAHGYMEPLPVRYGNWLGNFVAGDFGESVRFRVPVSEVLWPRLGNTAILGAAVFLVMVPLALGLGVLSGMREGSLRDRVITIVCVGTTSVPEFASTVLFSVVFVFTLGWLPGTSTMTDGFNPIELILPVTVLVIYDFGYVARMTRASMAEVMTTPYIRTAILKGLPYRQVILKHALRNALIAPFTIIMLQVNWLLSGVIVVEYFFAYKGFGALLLEAAGTGDIYVIEACTMVSVVVVSTTRLISDIGYTYLNPRIRFQ